MKSFFLILFFVGWTFIIIGYVQSYRRCPPNDIEYRYVPRKILDEQLSIDNNNVSDLYDKMVKFKDPLS
tara:strand:- start:241 stop:447 length:207 start_codon:yes stop_codon:yes gene_type:complete